MLKKLMLGMVGGFMAVSGAHAQAMDHSMHMAAESVSATASVAVEPSSTQAFKAADAKMHGAMMQNAYTGDADVDFLRGMIPHHQGAVDMANIVLKYGSDPDVRMLAGDIIKAQETEIRWMQQWLAKHGPKDGYEAPVTVLPQLEINGVTPTRPTPVVSVTTPVVKPVVEKTVEKIVEKVSSTVVPVVAPVVQAISETVTPAAASVSRVISETVSPMMMDGMPMSMTPDMPMPTETITNEAPHMELIDDSGKAK